MQVRRGPLSSREGWLPRCVSRARQFATDKAHKAFNFDRMQIFGKKTDLPLFSILTSGFMLRILLCSGRMYRSFEMNYPPRGRDSNDG